MSDDDVSPQAGGKGVAERTNCGRLPELVLPLDLLKADYDEGGLCYIWASEKRLPDCRGQAKGIPVTMDSDTAWMLSNVPRPGHIVYPYTDERQMVSAVGFYTSSGLARNGSVVLIVTQEHREAIKRYLSDDGNVEVFEQNGQLLFFDAHELLSSFMLDGNPDAQLFKSGIKKIIELAGHHPYTHRKREVRVLGEMVNLLWPSNTVAAERLEELGNEIIGEHSVPIL